MRYPTQETVWLYDTPIAVIKQHQTYAIHTDHLNTPRLITDTSNQTVWTWPNTEAFGNTPANEDPNNSGNLFTYNLRYPGQLYDTETKTHYNYFRDNYSPDSGRYKQSDPIGLAGGINTYLYVKGSPVGYLDPEGLAGNGGVGGSSGIGTNTPYKHCKNHPTKLGWITCRDKNGKWSDKKAPEGWNPETEKWEPDGGGGNPASSSPLCDGGCQKVIVVGVGAVCLAACLANPACATALAVGAGGYGLSQ